MMSLHIYPSMTLLMLAAQTGGYYRCQAYHVAGFGLLFGHQDGLVLAILFRAWGHGPTGRK